MAQDQAGFLLDKPISFDTHAPPTEADHKVTWGDWIKGVGSGVVDVGAGTAAAVEYATAGKVGGAVRKKLQGVSDDIMATTGPEFRRRVGAEWLPGDGATGVGDVGVGNAVVAQGIKAIPSIAAAIVPAALTASLMRGAGASLASRAVTAGAVARGTGAMLNAGQVASHIYDEIDKLDDTALAQKAPQFASYLTWGLQPAEARRLYKKDVADYAPVLAAAVSFATGGVEGQIGRRLGGEAAKGVLKGVAKGTIGEAVQETAESGGGEALAQGALNAAGLSDMDWRKVLSQAIGGGVVGGATGGALGGATNARAGAARHPRGAQITHTDELGPSPDQSIALEPVHSAPLQAPPAPPTIDIPPDRPSNGPPLSVPAAAQRLPTTEPGQPADPAAPAVPLQQAVAIAPEVNPPEEAATVAPLPPAAPPVPSPPIPAPAVAAAAPSAPPQNIDAPKDAIAPLVPPAEPAPALKARVPRVLNALDAESKANERAQKKIIAKNLRSITEELSPPNTTRTNHHSLAEKEERARHEAAAKSIFEDTVPEDMVLPTTDGGKRALRERLAEAVRRAEDAGVRIPIHVTQATPDHMAWLREVKDFVETANPKPYYIREYLISERAARSGDFSIMRERRRVEGDRASRVGRDDVDGAAAVTGGKRVVRDSLYDERPPSEVRKVQITEDVKRAALASLERAAARDGASLAPKGAAVVAKAKTNTKVATDTKTLGAPKKANGANIVGKAVDVAAKAAATAVTAAQKKAGNYKKGHIAIHGLDITIESPRGSERSGVGKDGKEWSAKMPDHYGYIKRTEGADGDHVDVYVGPNPASDHVVVIDQVDPDTRHFDEHKVMIGYANVAAAVDAYQRAFSDGRATERAGNVAVMSVADFKEWLKKDDTTQPVGHTGPAEPTEPSALRTVLRNPTSGVSVEAGYTSTVREVMGAVRTDHLAGVPAAMANFIKGRLTKYVGSLPLHVLTEDAMKEWDAHNLAKGHILALGFYMPNGKDPFIALRADTLNDPDTLTHVVLHEAVHAATRKAVGSKGELFDLIRMLAAETENNLLARGIDTSRLYAFDHDLPFHKVHEFIAEAFSNPAFQRLLAETPISKGLANDIGLGGNRLKSAWDWLIAIINRALGLPPGMHTALEGIIKLGEQAFAPQQAATPPTSAGVEPSALRGDLADAARDHAASAQIWVQRNWVKFVTLDQMRQQRAGLFVDGKGDALADLVSAAASMAPHITKMRDQYEKLAQRFLDFQRARPTAARTFAELGIEARMMDVNLGPNADNSHLGKDAAWGWQAKGRLAGLQARYDAMSPEAKKLWHDMVDFYRSAHNEAVRASVEALLDPELIKTQLTQQELAGVTSRVMFGKLTDADEGLLGETLFRALKNAREFRQVQGTYFPLMRYGDHVVRAVDTIQDTMGGRLVKPDTVEFRDRSETAARRAAEAFVRASDLVHIATEHVYIDASNGTVVTADEAKSLNDVDHGFRVRLQTEGVYFFPSRAAAERFVRINPEGHDTIHPPEDRLGEGYHAHALTGTQIATIKKSVDARTDISDGTKHLLASILAQASARMLSGNRLSSRRLKAQKVTGASEDFARNLLQYGDAAARHSATAKFMPHVRDALARMRHVMDRYEGKNRNDLVQTYNEVIKRVDQGIVEPNAPGKFMRDVMTVSFMARLFSPAYSVVNSAQVATVTLPVLGGRFGNMRAMAAVGRAYKDIGLGETVLAGLRNTKNAAVQFGNHGLLNTNDVIGDIRKRLSAQPDGAQLTGMLDILIEGGAIDPAAGFETANAIAEGRGAWGQTLAKVDRIARQLPTAVEAVNRTVTAVSAYRLAAEAHMPHDKAVQFAFDTAKNTQGDYAAGNQPRFFNVPVLRPAMQFKRYAQMISYLMADMTQRAFAGATKEERNIARKQLANIVATQILVAGALSLPGIELVKASFMVAAALGFGGGWDDQEERLRKLADEMFGQNIGQLITRGVVTRALNIDVSQRMSMSDMWIFGEPKRETAESVESYLLRQVAGSAGSLALDGMQGIRDLAGGDWAKGLEKLVPIKTLSDLVKAANRYSEGKTTAYEVGLNAFGFKSGRQAEASRDTGNKIRARSDIESRRKKLEKAYLGARTKGEQIKIKAQIVEHNKTAPLRLKVFPGALDKVRERLAAERVN